MRALRLVSALEATFDGADALAPADVAARLEERQPLLDELRALDLAALPPGPRAEVRAGLRRLKAANDDLLGRARAALDAVGAALGDLREARGAARAYRSVSAERAGLVLTRA